MNKQDAIRILTDELKHTEIHLQDKNKAPEFYEEMRDYCEAVRMAIKVLKIFLDIEEQYRKGLEKGLSEWETERPQGRMKGGAE